MHTRPSPPVGRRVWPLRLIVSALVSVALWAAGPSSPAALAMPNGVDDAGRARQLAVRDVQWSAGATCDLDTVRSLAGRHPDVRQFVVLVTAAASSTYGSAFVAVRRSDGTWLCQTSTFAARFGRTGTRVLADRRSGDGTTPAGVFPLGTVTAWDGEEFGVFGNRPDPGVHAALGYRDVRPEDCWGATPNDSAYNHLVADRGCPGPDDEWLQRYGDVYAHAAVIGANLDPISGDTPGETPYAAAIFLHRHSYDSRGATRPTSGCVSLSIEDLVDTVRRLDPTLDPHFAIGSLGFLRSSA